MFKTANDIDAPGSESAFIPLRRNQFDGATATATKSVTINSLTGNETFTSVTIGGTAYAPDTTSKISGAGTLQTAIADALGKANYIGCNIEVSWADAVGTEPSELYVAFTGEVSDLTVIRIASTNYNLA